MSEEEREGQQVEGGDVGEHQDQTEQQQTKLRLRNYVPSSKVLVKSVEQNESVMAITRALVDANKVLAAARARPSHNDPVVAPKRATHDLKLELEPQTRKLARRTKAAIHAIAESLQKEQAEAAR